MQGLNAKLSAAQARLVLSERMAALNVLVAGVAHELNTPIGNGLLAASTLQDFSIEFQKKLAQGISSRELGRYIETIVEGSILVQTNLQRAAELVGSFKQVAVARATLLRRRFDLGEMLHEIFRGLSSQTQRTPHTLDVDVPEGLWLDSFPEAFVEIVTHLLKNALLHGLADHPAGDIAVKAFESDEIVTIEFSDNGVGISADHLHRVFDPFFTTKLGQGGRGLGLHVVHNIVTGVLGGHIQVISERNEGTLFRIEVPAVSP